MNRALVYLALAGVAVVLQSVLLPLVMPGHYKPDLILILVIYLGLQEEAWRGGLPIYLLGWLHDGVAGAFPGLGGFVLLGVFLSVRAIVSRVNTESSPLLLLLVVAGTVLQVLLTAFALDFFSHTAGLWPQIIRLMPLQMVLNFCAAMVLLRLILWLQQTLMPRRDLPGLRKLDNHYES